MPHRLSTWTLVALLLACSSVGAAIAEGAKGDGPRVGRIQSNAVLRVGDPAPPWDAVDRAGRKVSLSEFDGRPVLLDFGSVFCMDCRNAIVYLEGVRQRYGSEGLAVVMIVVDGTRAVPAADRYWEQVEAGFPALFDVVWRTGRGYGVEMIPTQFLVDRHGMVRAIHVGFDETMMPDSLIRSVLSDGE